MSNYKLNRRTFITSTGAVFVLPMLESLFPFSNAFAQAASDPKRFVSFYFPNGTYNRADNPIWATPTTGAITAGNTSKAISPFASNYSNITMINNYRQSTFVNNDDHANGAMSFLACPPSSDMTGITSFDQLLADRLGKPAWVLTGGVTSADIKPWDEQISYRNGVGIKGISNPGDMYRELLGKISPTTTNPTATGLSARQKSILDASLADFASLRSTLGQTDRLKIDQFQNSVRELETKVLASTSTTTTGGSCTAPTLNATTDTAATSTSLYLPKFYAMNDMIKIAFACDITRVVTIMLDTETTTRTFAPPPASLIYNGAKIDGQQSHIAISHASPTPAGYDIAVTRDRVMMQIVVDLVEKLKMTTDPSGSKILDNTIIHSGFGVEDGNHGSFVGRRATFIMGGRNMLTGGKTVSLGGYYQKDILYTYSKLLGSGLASFRGSTTTVPL